MGGIGTALVASAAISAASSAYQGKKQREAAKDAERKRQKEAAAAKAEADRIARETKPEEEGLGEIEFGSNDADTEFGSANDFLVEKKISSLGTSQTTGSGLGFKL